MNYVIFFKLWRIKMLEKSLVSIIVPVYKVEKYLSRCIESIINQTYKNIEIILVDDGSPDDCPNICDEYAKADQRIIVVHKENEGLSSARNCGLNLATGDFIMFVDSDDTIDERMCEILISQVAQNKCDIVMSDFEKVRENINYPKNQHKTYNLKNIKNDVYDKNEEIVELLFNKKVPLIMLAWGGNYTKKKYLKIYDFQLTRYMKMNLLYTKY